MENLVNKMLKMGRHPIQVTYKDGTKRQVIPLDIDWEEYEENHRYVCRCLDPVTDGYVDIPNEDIESVRRLKD